MNTDYDFKQLKNYKGYEVFRSDRVLIDCFGRHIVYTVYLAADDEDFIGQEYRTIKEVHRFIDTLVNN